jgi:predicted restriction endonuclease
MGIMRPEIRSLSYTPENIAKRNQAGVNHPKWVENRAEVKTKRTMAELRWWRKAVFERDNYTCKKCGSRGGRLNAHHIKSYVLFPELREDMANGETLCVGCHKKTDTYGRKREIQNSIC